ncbi:hemagglutinin repeat-containing protein [Campylobacter concisus]|uniref:hemagglutinin repeat-containing protein n=1 Tax=Campylobacter concisus TaxID=199 RepID=UPI0015E1B5E9|nr:hemagglutinin repeat-containing protein [Campylobacter concisus]
MLKDNQISNAQKPSLLTIGLNFYVSLSLLLGTMPALANEPSIIADPGASNRPDILKAPNETLIINITNPDGKGVSINEYSRFNTPTTGTILNNSNKNIDTKIAGQIDANYRLNKEASLIINKVNSAEKSSLKGNLEVAGSRADVVIANPNGISVDGLNMINSRSLTLTTGNINKLSPKEIELISNNSIDIVGDGLNDKSSDYTNVISNAINLNSNIHANELNIIGEKVVTSSKDRLYNDVKAKNQENSFSLDSSALGGMYANKIKLVGTSNGVGVNNNGLVIANNNIEINLDGDIVNAGAIASNKDTSIKANTITNKDEALIAAKESLNIKAETLVNTSSQIYAKDINVEAKKLVNNSSSQARVDTVHKQGTMHLKKEGVNRYKLGVNLKELKEKIGAKLAKKLGKDISELDENEVNELVLKEAANKDGALYALNLHKDSHLVGTSQKIFHNLRLDYDTNEVLVDTSRAKNNEQKRTITYSIVKDVLNEDDKANFIPGSIIANNDINLNVNDVLNDKSVIYAGGDLRLNSDNVENIALMLNNHVNSYSVYKWKEKKKWYRGGGWKTKGGTGKVFNFSYTDVGLPAVFAAGNNIVGSTQDFSSYALNDDIKLANVDLDKFSEPIFNSPIIKNLNRRVKNQGYYYSLDSINSAYIANILDTLYEARNESISKFKKEAKDKNVKASALVMANNIELDAKGNISLAGSVVADNINLNADKKIKLKGAELSTSGDANIVANDIEIDSSDLKSKNLSLNAKNNINLDQSKSQFSKTSNLEATNDINLQAGNDIKVSGSNLDASRDINLNSGNNIEIKADEFSYTHHVSSKGMKFDESVKRVSAANLNANSDINLNAKNTLLVSSTHLNALKDINLKASDIILAAQSNTSEATAINSSKSLLSKKQTIDSAVSSEVVSASLKSGNNINLNSANDIYLVSSKLKSDKDINLNSNNNILFENGYNVEASSHSSKKSKISLNPNAFYKSSFDLVANGSKKAVYNTIDSGSDINLNAKSALSLKGANLNSQKDINLNAELIAISNTNDESYHKEEHKSSRVGFMPIKDVIKDIKADLKQKLNPIKDAKAKSQDASVKTAIFAAKYSKSNLEESEINAKSSNLSAKGNINLNSDEAISITGSNLTSDSDINLVSSNANISIANSISTKSKDSSSKEASAILSVTAQNEYAQIIPAILAIKQAQDQLKRVNREYEDYKSELSKLENTLGDIKQRYKNKEEGIDYSDIEDVKEIISEYKEEERYFKANIMLAKQNLEAKTLALVSQIAAAAASSGTYGFSVGVRADLKGTKSNEKELITKANPSNLKANNISIKTNQNKNDSKGDVSIVGSNLNAYSAIDISASDLDISSSRDTLNKSSNSKELSSSISYTFYGGNSRGIDIGYSNAKASEQSSINNNSYIYSNKDIKINTSNDLNIKGGDVRADETLSLKVGRNLNLESQVDTYNMDSKQRGLNVGLSYSGKTNSNHVASGDTKMSGVSVSVSKANSKTRVKQTNLSSITAGNIDIDVKNNTHLKGSLLAAGEYDKKGVFADNHNLNLKTNTLTYENMSNKEYSKNTNLSLGLNFKVSNKESNEAENKQKNDPNFSGLRSTTISSQRDLSYALSKTMATLGKGNIKVTDLEESDELDRLNRDTTKLTKDLVSTSISSKIDATIDGRLSSKEGLKEISKEYKDLNKNMNIIASTLPDKNSDNVIAKTFGNIFEGLNYISLGIIPSKENRGGILANIPVLTGVFDNSNRQYLVVNKESDKYSEKDFEKIQDSKFFKSLSDADKEKFKDQQDLYISKNPYEITKKTATFQNFTNGMMNNEAEAIKNGLQQTGFWNTKSGKVELTVNYNPSYGFLGDLLESAVDKFGGITGIAKQTGNFYNDVVGARGDKGSNFANHSQANGLAKSGIKWKVNNGGFNVNNGKHTIVSFGSPISREEMSKIIDLANSKAGNEQFVYSGSYTKKGDFVGEALGGNSEDNKDASLTDRLNILNAIKLFTDNSPHSEYVCQDYINNKGDTVVKCGYQ